MKTKPGKKRGANPSKGKKSIKDDPFFNQKQKRRRVLEEEDSDGEEFSDDDDLLGGGETEGDGRVQVNGGEDEEETADERRQRVARAYLEKIREIAKREEEEGEEEEEGDDDEEEEEDDAERRAGRRRGGDRDELVAKILQQKQLEDSGRVRRQIASMVQKPETEGGFRVLVKHRQPVTSVALSEDDLKGFSASKDGTILQWDVNSGKGEKYLWPGEEVLKSHGAKDPQGRASKHSKHVLALAISSDGRYLASGGLDRHVHLWDTRTRKHIQAFPGHRGPVSCLSFRKGTSELLSGSFDRTIKIFNAEDRAYINTLFGHQSEILTIDCLRKERALTVGRDRTMQLFKIPEETRIVFRSSTSSLECCCFINNDEYLTGSDDGSIELWNMLRKKPVHIVKNAHPSLNIENGFAGGENGMLPNGHKGETISDAGKSMNSAAYSWVSSVAVCSGSDLAASGAGNGYVRLWAIRSETKDVEPLYDLPLVGFVNSLAFARSGKFLVAGVGQEPRLGRWGRLKHACNGIALHPLKLS
ncbi:hypothetical protein MLD38_027635 [Melastoma candidum]|uniref:Uncharacterized protein n=1 Tax=Melastoma candidum TaxID=119954 RepID=A0ACB9P2D8_9MYRT|nr:hypothetical protein MLD38_027635 [Melastoma candidum]